MNMVLIDTEAENLQKQLQEGKKIIMDHQFKLASLMEINARIRTELGRKNSSVGVSDLLAELSSVTVDSSAPTATKISLALTSQI
jgi:hypothetical protein